jgi:20S proteasome alpha/beta subunit
VSSRYGNNKDNSIFPVGNFQASLAASEGQATIVALQLSCDDTDYVIIVSRSPNIDSNYLSRSLVGSGINNSDEINESSEDISFLTPIRSRGALTSFYDQREGNDNGVNIGKRESRTIHVLHEQVGICLAMTGFASDVNHLVRFVANAVSEHEYLYGGGVPTVHSLVRNTLASYMRDATTFGGSRPFGVQGMLVGNERGSTQLFTVDPSGIFKHCASGIASIGKNAESVRGSILKMLKDEGKVDDSFSLMLNIQYYLDIAIKSILENTIDVNDISDPNLEVSKQFETVVLFGGKNCKRPYKFAVLNHEMLSKSCCRSVEAIISKHNSKII